MTLFIKQMRQQSGSVQEQFKLRFALAMIADICQGTACLVQTHVAD